MGLRLVFSREVQIDIRDLVPLEPKEGLKRDIMPILNERNMAIRTLLIRKVKSRTDGTIIKEFRLLAFRAYIMRRKRVNLRDFRHRCNERGTDGTTRANEISIIERLLNKLMRDQV